MPWCLVGRDDEVGVKDGQGKVVYQTRKCDKQGKEEIVSNGQCSLPRDDGRLYVPAALPLTLMGSRAFPSSSDATSSPPANIYQTGSVLACLGKRHEFTGGAKLIGLVRDGT